MLNKHGIKLTSKRRVRQAYMAAADKITLPWQDAGASAKRSKRPVVFAAVRAAACVALVIALGAVATGAFRTPKMTGKAGGTAGSGSAAAGNNFTLSVLAADAPTTSGTSSGTELKPGVEVTLPGGIFYDLSGKKGTDTKATIKYNGGIRITGDTSHIKTVEVSVQGADGAFYAEDDATVEQINAILRPLNDAYQQNAEGKTAKERQALYEELIAEGNRLTESLAKSVQETVKNVHTSGGNGVLSLTGAESGRFGIIWEPDSPTFTSVELTFSAQFTDGSKQTKIVSIIKKADGTVVTQLKS